MNAAASSAEKMGKARRDDLFNLLIGLSELGVIDTKIRAGLHSIIYTKRSRAAHPNEQQNREEGQLVLLTTCGAVHYLLRAGQIWQKKTPAVESPSEPIANLG
jgi:hypothetical protein